MLQNLFWLHNTQCTQVCSQICLFLTHGIICSYINIHCTFKILPNPTGKCKFVPALKLTRSIYGLQFSENTTDYQLDLSSGFSIMLSFPDPILHSFCCVFWVIALLEKESPPKVNISCWLNQVSFTDLPVFFQVAHDNNSFFSFLY